MISKDAVRQNLKNVFSQFADTRSSTAKYIPAGLFEPLKKKILEACEVVVLDEQKLALLEDLVRNALQKNLHALQDYIPILTKELVASDEYVSDTILTTAFQMVKSTGRGARRIAHNQIDDFITCVMDTLFSEDIPKASSMFEVDMFQIIQSAFRVRQNMADRAYYIAVEMQKIISRKKQ